MKVSAETYAPSMDKPRAARPTIKFIDEYCDSYRNLFPEVRSVEAFKHLHVGMISPIKRKTLPEIALVRRIRAGTSTPSLSDKITLGNKRTEKAKARFDECKP